MDGPHLEHSDSDSGDSWTMLDHSPQYAEDAPEVPDTPDSPSRRPGEETDNVDEDTDGISIITDSEPESHTPIEHLYYEDHPHEHPEHPTETDIPDYILQRGHLCDNAKECIRESVEDFLGDPNGKMKIYVHRKNKRISTVLNIIVLGSIITAAGVAIGHIWGIKDDCSTQSAQSINKILSNLYKLQEENAYLRSKLKELTMMNNMHMKKPESQKLSPKHLRCKKVFEESLSNKNVEQHTKCVDGDNSSTDKALEDHLVEPDFEKEFISDITKLRNVYKQNKSLLDDEVNRRLKFEQTAIKRLKNRIRTVKLTKENKTTKDGKPLQAKFIGPMTFANFQKQSTEEELQQAMEDQKKVSYADSLKSIKYDPEVERVKRDIGQISGIHKLDKYRKKKANKVEDNLSEQSFSDDDLGKDDRYVGHKFKLDRKKSDRQKSMKKQKRKNKYEQWEMKGGYMKDYDDFSVSSSQENAFVLKNPDKNEPSRDFERVNYIEQFAESENHAKSVDSEVAAKKRKIEDNPNNEKTDDVKPEKGEKGHGKEGKHGKEVKTSKNDKANEKSLDWFEKRASIRSQARKKLEQELFGNNTPNAAAWYFKRMQKREQCRVKTDGTAKKTHTRMNFKTKQ